MDFIHSQLQRVETYFAWVQTEPIDWKLWVQIATWSITLFESYLLVRQLPYYDIKEPPAALKEHFEPGQLEKSQAYGKDTTKYLLFHGLYGQVVKSMQVQFGYHVWVWSLAGDVVQKLGYGQTTLAQAVAFNFISSFIMSILTHFPTHAYHTFVVEEKHGFNKTTPMIFITDKLKHWGIMLFIGAPFSWITAYVLERAGDRLVPYLLATSIVAHVVFMVIFPLVIQPMFNKVTPIKDEDLKQRVQRLASKVNFPLSSIYQIDGSKRSSHSNAYFYGLPWNKHIVLFDTLIEQHKQEEVEAVLAHELGHWYHMHTLQYSVLIQVITGLWLTLFPPFLHAPPVLLSLGFDRATSSSPPPFLAYTIFFLITAPLFSATLFAVKILSRKCEFEADRFAVEFEERVAKSKGAVSKPQEENDMGEWLARALITLNVKNKSAVWVDWMYSSYHHTHPTLGERLEAIQQLRARKTKKVA